MLKDLLRSFFADKSRKAKISRFDISSALLAAETMMASGDKHGAADLYREILDHTPNHVEALNNLSFCLSDLGDHQQALRIFELAYALDDTFLPVVVNRAKLLADQRQTAPARELLERAKVTDPNFWPIFGVYQSTLFQHGKTQLAVQYARKAWLANFDNLRLANALLFSSGYMDISEASIASEHLFWAETIARPCVNEIDTNTAVPATGGRIRIGYFSPDFRNHSVRFFFRPLLESHNPSDFEVFLYHDAPMRDEQTELMAGKAEHFHDVSALSDSALSDMWREHCLDVLVDLCGHTSYNRMHLFSQRHAPVQINAIGYPPTTGLSTMDYKLIDRYVWTKDHARYYTERPLVLPSSFWCFDPMEDVPIAGEPPCVREQDKPLVFGCVGNIAKITEPILQCWSSIMERVPNSRLLLRSINFQDDTVMETMRARLQSFGLDLNRIDLKKPEGGAAFFSSYEEIDIILDTYPFNGGTTTSFAVFMGVPVITWAGHSLISRMGLSIMTNMQAVDAIAFDGDGYIDCAVNWAGDKKRIQTFKREARTRLAHSPLGNGKLFAAEWEAAVADLVRQHRSGGISAFEHQVAPLPIKEMVQRAYEVLRRGQHEAAQRVVNCASQHAPHSASVCILQTQLLWDSGQREVAIQALREKMDQFQSDDQAHVRLYMASLYAELDDHNAANALLRVEDFANLTDAFDRTQWKLLRSSLEPYEPLCEQSIPAPRTKRVLIVFVHDSFDDCADLERNLFATCPPPAGIHVETLYALVRTRIADYSSIVERDDIDVALVLHKNVRLTATDMWSKLLIGLESVDVLSFAGALRWKRFDWRADKFEQKCATYFVLDKDLGRNELRWIGTEETEFQHRMAVVDGSMFAFSPQRLRGVPIDEELLGAGTLIEEDWFHTAYQRGCALGTVRTLGVQLDEITKPEDANRTEAYLHLVGKKSMEVFSDPRDDDMYAAVPVKSAAHALRICQQLTQGK